jgi:hypothetical protein
MARRGPIPRGEYSNKSRVLSTRIRDDTRQALERAVAESKRSLSQEIEFRLRRSLADDVDVSNRFGSRRNYAMLRMISCVMDLLSDDNASSWLDEPFKFEKAKRAIDRVLEAFRPPGDIKVPEGFEWISVDDLLTVQSDSPAAGFLLAIRDAEAPNPNQKRGDDPASIAPFIKADLGKRVERIKGMRAVMGNSKDFRRAAEEMEREEKEEDQKR